LTQESEIRHVTGIVKQIASVDTGQGADMARYGIKFEAADISKFPIHLFVDAVATPELGKRYQVALKQGKKTDAKYDGSKDWHFYWDAVPGIWEGPLDGDNPVPAPQQVAQPQQQTQGTPVPAAPMGGWDGGNDVDRRESLKEISFHKQKSLAVAQRALGSTTESALMIEDYVEQLTVLYRASLALLREPLPEEVEPEEESENAVENE
jgi:hypothetical protein